MTYWPLEDAEPDASAGAPRCVQCGHPGGEATHHSWTFGTPGSLGAAGYICRDSAACSERMAAGDDSGPDLPVRKESASHLVPQALLDDYAGTFDIGDWLGKAMRGEIEFRPRPEPRRHRCLACWLVSLLPGHDRCSHGYPESGCETCGEW